MPGEEQHHSVNQYCCSRSVQQRIGVEGLVFEAEEQRSTVVTARFGRGRGTSVGSQIGYSQIAQDIEPEAHTAEEPIFIARGRVTVAGPPRRAPVESWEDRVAGAMYRAVQT